MQLRDSNVAFFHIAGDLMQHLSLDQTYFERYGQREMKNRQQHARRS